MRERPILFQGAMVRALLAGTKTQTRRPVKCEVTDYGGALLTAKVCPYGQPGDRLWVRESWRTVAPGAGYSHLATDGDGQYPPGPLRLHKWRPSIHMPRAACRLVLEITAVRVERLQDCSESDAKAEGIYEWMAGLARDPGVSVADVDELIAHYGTGPVAVYAALWDSMNGCDAWAANPWVWVVELRPIDKGAPA